MLSSLGVAIEAVVTIKLCSGLCVGIFDASLVSSSYMAVHSRARARFATGPGTIAVATRRISFPAWHAIHQPTITTPLL